MGQKLKLVPDAIFEKLVHVPVAGEAQPREIVFNFKYKSVSERDKLLQDFESFDDVVEPLMEIIDGWDLDEVFSQQNLKLLIDNYDGLMFLILQAYVFELTKAREKN